MKIDTFKVEEWFNEYEHKARYDLGDTCAEPFSINELLEFCSKDNKTTNEIFAKKLNYGDIHGSQRLKKAICSLYTKQKEGNITVTHGAIGANQLVIQSIVEKGDKVVSIIPTYQQHYSIPKSLGANVKLFYLKEENNWLPDLKELEHAVGDDTKLICMNNPNNPTGAVISDDTLKRIVEIARKSNAYILCDEVYRGLNHCDNHFSESIADIYEKGISTGSMSKTFSLAGLRLGWVAAGEEIIKEINHQREYNTISVGILDDYFASIAIENKAKIIKRNIDLIRTGKQILMDWVNSESKVRCIEPKGGTTAFVGYNFEMKSTDLCKKLQEDTGIMILPGETLELDGYLRIGYANHFETLKTALEKFSHWMNKNI